MSLKNKSLKEALGTPSTKRRRSLYRSVLCLTVGEENVNLKMTVVAMKDVFSFDKKSTIRNLIGSLCLFDLYHLCELKLFGELFGFQFYLGKNDLAQNISVAPSPPAAYNYGNVDFALSFKPASIVEIVKVQDEMFPSKVKQYVEYLAETRFFLDVKTRTFDPLTSAFLQKNNYIDAEISVIGIDDLRFICNDGVLQSVLDITCSSGKMQVKLTAWNLFALFLHSFSSNSHGALIRVEHVKAGIFTPNSSSQFAGLFGAIKVSLRLLILTDMCPTGSNHGLFVGTATDGMYKCQIYTQHQLNFKFHDEILVSKVSVQWTGALLVVTVISEQDVQVFSDPENFKIVDAKEIDDLDYPENST
uniref:Uncharacterized protein n=1 Tax=Ditylenchus dipsaci TaxID=166011 RepID=A0A915EC75_9BILA